MSSTLQAPYAYLGPGGDYPIEANFGIRVYDNIGEVIPAVGKLGYTLKGGLRTNYIGNVPLMDGTKKVVGIAEVLCVIACKPENMDPLLLRACDFESLEDALTYVRAEHGEEFARDSVFTVYIYRTVSRT